LNASTVKDIDTLAIASASPSPLNLDELEAARIELDWKINLAKCEARVLRDNRRINSRHPTVFLSYGCTEAYGDRLEEACAVRDAWLPSMPVRVVTQEDPMWLVEGWSAHDEDFENKMLELRVDEDVRDRAELFGDPFQGQHVFSDEDVKRLQPVYAKADKLRLESIESADNAQLAITDSEEIDSAMEDYHVVKPRQPSKRSKKKGANTAAPGKSDDGQCPISDKGTKALWKIKRKGDIPTKGLNAIDARTARIYNYGLWRADTTEELRKATVTEDVAVAFTMHALHLIEDGKYEEQGKLLGWLGWVWMFWIWKAGGLKRTILESRKFSGLQSWDAKKDEGRADIGRVLEGSTMSDALQNDECAQNDEDILTSVLSQRLAEMRSGLNSIDLGLIEDLSAGATHKQAAKKMGISTKSVQRRLAGIKEKAHKVNSKPAADSCPLPGTIAGVCASSEVAA